MTRKLVRQHRELQHRDLFETKDPSIVLLPDQKNRLLALLQALLIEITAPPASQNVKQRPKLTSKQRSIIGREKGSRLDAI